MATALLLSGGMDSIALAYWLRPMYAYTIDYGQRGAAGEVRAATAVAQALHIRHSILTVDCRALGSGDMVGTTPSPVAPVTEWWPFRNQLLVTLAAMRGLADGVTHLLLGSVASDGVHADGRAAFVTGLDALLREQEGGMRLSAPAMTWTTVDLVRHAAVPRALLAWAHSCHTAPYACGQCRGCAKHLNVTEALFGHAEAY